MMTSGAPFVPVFMTLSMLTNGVPGLRNGSPSALDAAAHAIADRPNGSCFLLYEIGVGETRRAPSAACRVRVSPQSTFKIPHALAALDSGVLAGADTSFAYDGSPQSFEAWRHDHTLASAMRFSVVWFFQRVAERLGETRERDYLRHFAYGNADSSSGLTSFWLGGSLTISPEEQERFLLRLYGNTLSVSQQAMDIVRKAIVQPSGMIVNATGEHSFGDSWPLGTVLSAKTGSGRDRSGQQVRWLVGHVSRERRSWVFVSCVIGTDQTALLAAVDLAAQALRHERVF
jgi:beta-lactamase class D